MMSNNKWHTILAVIGFLFFVIGNILSLFFVNEHEFIKILTIILISLGAAFLSVGLNFIIKTKRIIKNPRFAKELEICNKDERFIALTNKAKSKVFDFILIIFPSLFVFFTIMRVEKFVMIVFGVSYLLVVALLFYFLSKYQKEM